MKHNLIETDFDFRLTELLLYNLSCIIQQNKSHELCTLFALCCVFQMHFHFADDIFTYIFFNENVWNSLQTSLKFVPKFQINNIPELVQIMAWHQPGHKSSSEPMMFSLLMHMIYASLGLNALLQTVRPIVYALTLLCCERNWTWVKILLDIVLFAQLLTILFIFACISLISLWCPLTQEIKVPISLYNITERPGIWFNIQILSY